MFTFRVVLQFVRPAKADRGSLERGVLDQNPGGAQRTMGVFRPTPWTVITWRAGAVARKREHAVAELCRIYWRPLFCLGPSWKLASKLFAACAPKARNSALRNFWNRIVGVHEFDRSLTDRCKPFLLDDYLRASPQHHRASLDSWRRIWDWK